MKGLDLLFWLAGAALAAVAGGVVGVGLFMLGLVIGALTVTWWTVARHRGEGEGKRDK